MEVNAGLELYCRRRQFTSTTYAYSQLAVDRSTNQNDLNEDQFPDWVETRYEKDIDGEVIDLLQLPWTLYTEDGNAGSCWQDIITTSSICLLVEGSRI